MPRIKFFLSFILILMILASACSKKHHPGRTPPATDVTTNAADSAVVKKPIARPKTVTPKVITVNDNAAHKSIDGRLYYDLEGKRYWKNYKDGKYYIFNKSMYNSDAFKPQ